MPEAEVLHNMKSTRARGNTDVATPSTDEQTYCNINYSETQRPASSRRSGVTWERVALLLLSVLLAAALTALGVTLHENTQTIMNLQRNLQKLQDEAKNLTDDSDERLMKATTGTLSTTEPCKVEQPTQPPLVRKETCPRCEDGWEPHGGKCYFFSLVTLNWTQSRTQCKSMGGDLVVINSREEQEFLESRVSEKIDKFEDKFWIGLTDSEKEGEWLWVDDTRLNTSLTFWGKGQPDNWTKENRDGEDCVRMGEEDGAEDLKTWFDKSCKSPQKSICEKPEKA